ncbi:methyltransferase domain-containing protein [Rhizobium cremeum]|uniref:methyltransferase domain-containing protein n=1 Tax=Rhizobium cremeum TaxID=2813827 RepID=UPI000DDB20E9|nr:methyltransferase domain-containing protein [Rhizobium cremeum]MCJ8001673.1 methyltransferase domain-containing protein [Rhizobium cremeum]
MNLFDIVKRNDRCVEILDGSVEPFRYDKPQWFCGVTLQPGARLKLKRIDEFAVMETFPRDFGWSLVGAENTPSPIKINVCSSDGRRADSVASLDSKGAILLTWPSWIGYTDGYDLEIVNSSDKPLELKSGPVFDPRAATRGYLRGTGIEVGPGSNPFVKPSADVDVRYLEALPIDEWLRNYGKHIEVTPEKQELWSRYILGDAQRIECCETGSLDFIFSNHVFEHLMNPLGVLENWSNRLKPTGVVVGVVPDLRYCFDLRQPASTPTDWLSEYEAGAWALTSAKYEKWCKYTAPYNTPEDLAARNYSIHAHYYTPSAFRQLAMIAIEKGLFSNFFLSTSPNNKDFGWILWRDPNMGSE